MKNSVVGMDFSPLITVLEGDFNTDNASVAEVDTLENLDDGKQISKGKPPRHLSVMQHITSTTTSRLQVVVNPVIYMTHNFWIFLFVFCNGIRMM